MKKPRFVIFHGTGGDPTSNWFPWLAEQLISQGYRVDTPKFPTPEAQNLTNWLAAFDEQIGELSSDMVLVGHSMGVGMILRLLERTDTAVTAAFLVSGWEGLLDLPDFDPLIESFYRKPFDYSRIRANIENLFLYHGSDDPYVPLSMGEDLAKNLGADLKEVPNGGHLNAERGLLEFPLLLNAINEFVKTL